MMKSCNHLDGEMVKKHWIRFIGQKLPTIELPEHLDQLYKKNQAVGECGGPEYLIVKNDMRFDDQQWVENLLTEVVKLGQKLVDSGSGSQSSFAFPVKLICTKLLEVLSSYCLHTAPMHIRLLMPCSQFTSSQRYPQ
jgi:hypothetical protein